MSDNYNINTTQAQSYEAGGIDPNDPSQTIAQSLANNQLKQQEQAQLVQQAVEKTKQAKIGTAEAQDVFDTKGYLSEKGLMPKSQALGELKIILEKQDMDDDEVKKIVSQAETSWPEELDGNAIWRWFSALREQKPTAAMHGGAFQATDEMKGQEEADGTPVVVGQWYQKNTDGDLVRTGQPPAEVNAADKGSQVNQKHKTDLVKTIAKQLEARRGNWMSQGLYRCSVALQKLHNTPNMTKQDLYQIAQDVASIFTGGVPTEDEIALSAYSTKANDLLNHITSLTGRVFGVPVEDIRNKLISVVQPLYDELIQKFETYMDLLAQGFLDVINGDPSWWADTKQLALHAAEQHTSPSAAIMPSGNILPVGSAIPSSTGGQPVSNQKTTPSGISYSVE